MPNQRAPGVTPRTVAFPDDLWQQVIQAVKDDGGVGTTPSMIVRAAVRQYVAKAQKPARKGKP